jgi:hypothetical protein
MSDYLDYGIAVHRADGAEWVVKSVRHLTPEENKGNHHVYVDALEPDGSRAKGLRFNWGWDGGSDQISVALDKPEGEPMGNLPMWKGQVVAVWMGDDSDVVTGLHTLWPDESGPNGEKWNTRGHHSFHVVFQRVAQAQQPRICPCCGKEL